MVLNIFVIIYYGFFIFMRILDLRINDKVVKYCIILNNLVWFILF